MSTSTRTSTASSRRLDLATPLSLLRGLLARTACAAPCIALALLAADARAQTIVPVPAPTGASRQATPARALPAPVSESERRFRSTGDYIRSRGGVDASMRADLDRLARDLDADIGADGAPAATVSRLLAARVQVAMWLGDRAGRDDAFTRLANVQPNKDAVLIAWARELVADSDFERAYGLVNPHPFMPDRIVDSRVLMAECLFGLNRFMDAQAMINGTPSARSPEQITALAQLTSRIALVEPLWEAETAAIARDQSRGDLPIVELLTSKGAITLELFEDQAPNTVGNMIEHVEAGTYNGTRFHRIMRGVGVQGGDPSTATGGAGGTSTGGWTIPDEKDNEAKRAPLSGRLIVALQPDPQGGKEPKPHSGGCQFMILLNHYESIQNRFTVFGRVTDGLDVARELTTEDVILSAQVIRKRNQSYQGVRFSTDATGTFTLPGPPIGSRPSATAQPPAPRPLTPTNSMPPEAVRDLIGSRRPTPNPPAEQPPAEKPQPAVPPTKP